MVTFLISVSVSSIDFYHQSYVQYNVSYLIKWDQGVGEEEEEGEGGCPK